MSDQFQETVSEPGIRTYIGRFVGGTTAVTKVAGTGNGVTVTYISTGIVDLYFPDNPGVFICANFGFQATTASGVKGYTVVPGVYNASTYKLRLNITGASESLVDLAALQWLAFNVSFQEV